MKIYRYLSHEQLNISVFLKAKKLGSKWSDIDRVYNASWSQLDADNTGI